MITTRPINLGWSGLQDIVRATADQTLRADQHVCFVTRGASDITVTLPAASEAPGVPFVIKALSGSTGDVLIVSPESSPLLSLKLTEDNQEVGVVSNGAEYQVVHSYGVVRDELPTIDARVWNAPQTIIGTAAADDLGQSYNTLGTASPSIVSSDFGGLSSAAYCYWQYKLPESYVPGAPITLRANAGMLTTVADTSCDLDFNVYNKTKDATTDICATDAQDINSLTAADKDFTITPTDCEPGDVLEVRAGIAYVDAGDAGVMQGSINSVEMRPTCRR